MDTAILSASAALIGSLIGGVSTFAASWLTQRRMLRTQTIMQHAMQRTWNHQAEGPDVIAGLYSAVARMRLTSSSEIIKRAEQVIRHIIAAYADPNKTFDEFKRHVQDPKLADPLRNFTEACREELTSLRA
jgi:hypothetical protein